MKIDFNKGGGLVPVIVQHFYSGEVLMLGYMNAEALLKTQSEGRVTFFSRSKKRLWTKGETSGNYLTLKGISLDCDGDALLIKVDPAGPACHTGERSCFGDRPSGLAFLDYLAGVIKQRHREGGEQSYTAKLFSAGTKRIAQKVGEEGLETALAAVAEDRAALLNESADLLFHLMVLLEQCGADLCDVIELLEGRHPR